MTEASPLPETPQPTESTEPTDSAEAPSSPQPTPGAWGYGLATVDLTGAVLDVWFPEPMLGERTSAARHALTALERLAGRDDVRRVTREVRTVEVADLQAPPTTTEDVWLRLHLLSHRLVAPRTINLDGVFGLLANVVWTSAGPCPVDGFEATRARLMLASGQRVTVYGVDKFPRMVDYVLPTGVRIGDADRVRLGAHLAEGTTVMHEGFVNYNAGTLGASMVEGRVSAGVVVGADSDVGGGASIMGTLSGGGTQVVSVGERCLIGANAGLGISLGDDCVVEAGCYVTAGTKLTVTGVYGATRVVKAVELSGVDNVLFRRNSVSGAVEAVPWRSDGVALNAALHAN